MLEIKINDVYDVPMACPKCLRLAGFKLKVIAHADSLGRPFSQVGIRCKVCGYRWSLPKETDPKEKSLMEKDPMEKDPTEKGPTEKGPMEKSTKGMRP